LLLKIAKLEIKSVCIYISWIARQISLFLRTASTQLEFVKVVCTSDKFNHP